MDLRVQLSRQLTFACFKSFYPSVPKFQVTRFATLLEPGGSTSTATERAGFLDGAAFGTRYRGGGDRDGAYFRY